MIGSPGMIGSGGNASKQLNLMKLLIAGVIRFIIALVAGIVFYA